MNGKLSVMDVIIILGAGFVGALAYTFSDYILGLVR